MSRKKEFTSEGEKGLHMHVCICRAKKKKIARREEEYSVKI